MSVIAVRDIELHYELHGTDGPVILLIHGLGSSGRDWEHQVGELAARYRVLTVDLRGHGKTSRQGPITIAAFAADLAELLDGLALAPVYVTGISMGTAVAFQLALDRPDLALGVVIINGGPVGLSSANPLHQRELEQRIAAVNALGMHGFGERLAERLLPAADHEPMRRIFVDRWAANDPAMYLASLGAMVDWTVWHRIWALTVPCGVIAGDRDYTPISFKEAYIRELPEAELVVIADSGHMTTHDQPRALSAAILRFVDQWSRQLDRPCPDAPSQRVLGSCAAPQPPGPQLESPGVG